MISWVKLAPPLFTTQKKAILQKAIRSINGCSLFSRLHRHQIIIHNVLDEYKTTLYRLSIAYALSRFSNNTGERFLPAKKNPEENHRIQKTARTTKTVSTERKRGAKSEATLEISMEVLDFPRPFLATSVFGTAAAVVRWPKEGPDTTTAVPP